MYGRYCYVEGTNRVLKKYEKSLRLLYDVFAYGDGAIGDELRKTNLMDFPEFYEILDKISYVDECITWREVKQSYAWSRLIVVEEDTPEGACPCP